VTPLLGLWFALALVSLLALFFIPAPYGRYAETLRGPVLPARRAWAVMEAPAVLVFAGAFLAGGERLPGAWVLGGCWMLHYLHRAVVYPLQLAPGSRPMPLAIVALGFTFNCVNGALNGDTLVASRTFYGAAWLVDPRFVVGALLFGAGYSVNRISDRALRGLRRLGETGYGVPQGGLFRWVSCPNYLGECVEWIGWAVMTWSLAGAAFAVWTLANLVPRARAHHLWYKVRYADYPQSRRALVPGLW